MITSYLRTKDTRLSAINIRVPGEPGNEARLDSGLEYGLNFGLDFGLNSIMYELTFVLELSRPFYRPSFLISSSCVPKVRFLYFVLSVYASMKESLDNASGDR